MGSREYHNEAWLREKYHGEGLTLGEMGEMCGVTGTTISDWMDRHGIEKRGVREAQRISGKHTDREWLAEQYHGKGRTLRSISEECDVDPVTIMNWMKRHNIPRRNYGKAHREEKVTRIQIDRGYIRLGARVPGEKKHAYVFEHQLVAIANGADPEKVFSDGDHQCHHVNGIPWDNRPENIEVLTGREHANEHWPDRERAATGEFL